MLMLNAKWRMVNAKWWAMGILLYMGKGCAIVLID